MIKKTILAIFLLPVLILVACVEDAVIEDKYYQVSFVTNSDTVLDSLAVLEGALVNQPTVVKDGYELIGWFLDSEYRTPWKFNENTVNNSITLYAKWEIIPIQNTITTEEMLVKLKNSIFQDTMLVEGQSGLSNPSEVGVNQEKLENEVRYPIPVDSEFAHIFNVSEYGILPTANDNTAAFRVLLNAVKAVDGLKLIRFESGIYQFGETIDFVGINDLYIIGDQTEWVMRSWQTIMRITESENFHINDIDFDYEISPTIAGVVQAVDSAESKISILVDDEFDLTNFRYNNGKINYGNYMEYVYDDFAKTYIPDANGMLRYNSTGDNIKGIKDGSYDALSKILTLQFDPIQGAFKAPDLGKIVSVGFTMYEYSGFIIKDSKDFYMESINIYTTPGMSIRSETSENLYLNRTNLMIREGSKRLMTATADGIHSADTIGDIIISNSIFERSHDDSINIKTFYFKVDSAFRSSVTLNMTTTEVRIPIRVGDELEFFEKGSFVSKATRTVTAVQAYGTSYEITLDRNLPSGLVLKDDLVGNISRIPKVSIENSIFRNKRNRGILVQFRDSVIENSAFYNIIHGPVMVHAAFDVFAEAVVPKNITIRNSKFINNNQGRGLNGDISVFRYGGQIFDNTIVNILIENNYFYQSNYAAVHLLGTGEITVRNNVFHDVSTKISGSNSYNTAIHINTVIDTTIAGNLVYMSQVKASFTFLYATADKNTINEENVRHNVSD